MAQTAGWDQIKDLKGKTADAATSEMTFRQWESTHLFARCVTKDAMVTLVWAVLPLVGVVICIGFSEDTNPNRLWPGTAALVDHPPRSIHRFTGDDDKPSPVFWRAAIAPRKFLQLGFSRRVYYTL